MQSTQKTNQQPARSHKSSKSNSCRRFDKIDIYIWLLFSWWLGVYIQGHATSAYMVCGRSIIDYDFILRLYLCVYQGPGDPWADEVQPQWTVIWRFFLNIYLVHVNTAHKIYSVLFCMLRPYLTSIGGVQIVSLGCGEVLGTHEPTRFNHNGPLYDAFLKIYIHVMQNGPKMWYTKKRSK